MNTAETVFQQAAFSEENVGKVNNFTGRDLTTNTYYFRPGQTLGQQARQIGDQVYVVLSGQGQFYLNNGSEERIDVAPGSIVYIPTGVSFRMQNSGQEEMICTEVCHPNHVQ
ncbi:MAG TPA: cupin domain-containing protein [Bacilli bacterium]|nr:cupin domain-containing protein [Bacilli bacterium]